MSRNNELFESNLKKICEHLENNNIPILRLLYIDSHNEMMSLTMPTSKLISTDISQLIRFFSINDLLLLPDPSTGFSDPSSVQENYCVISTLDGDERDNIRDKSIEIMSKINFILNDYQTNNLDIFHDFRNELVLEGIKAGVDIVSHHTSNNRTQSISFESNSLLKIADSIHKMKFLINCIAGAYGQRVDSSSKDNTVEFYKKSGRCIMNESMEISPYYLVKKL